MEHNAQKLLSWFVIFFAISCVIFLLLTFSLSRIIPYEDKDIHTPDIIVVVSGGDIMERTKKGVELYYAYNEEPRILFSGASQIGISNAEFMKRVALSRGVNPEKILLEEDSENTFENALFSRDVIRRIPEVKNVLVVSSPYHTRRVRSVFSRVFEGEDIFIQYIRSDELFFSHPKDFFSGGKLFLLYSEVVKNFYIWLGGSME